jgi:hypothetical protein
MLLNEQADMHFSLNTACACAAVSTAQRQITRWRQSERKHSLFVGWPKENPCNNATQHLPHILEKSSCRKAIERWFNLFVRILIVVLNNYFCSCL